MNPVRHTPIMFMVISLLAVSLIYSSSSTFNAFGAPRDPRFDSGSTCKGDEGQDSITCCWREKIPGSILGEEYCQTCRSDEEGRYTDCDPKELQVRPLPEGDLPQAEIVPPIRTLPGGDIKTLEQVPTLEPGPGFNQGTEGEPPLPVVCSEEAGLEKDPETGQCVPIESPVTEEPEESTEQQGEQQQTEEEQEQPEPEEEQPSEESDSESGDNGNN